MQHTKAQNKNEMTKTKTPKNNKNYFKQKTQNRNKENPIANRADKFA